MPIIQEEIAREIAENTILVYGKGTKTAPRCGFTLETIEFFNRFGYPFEVIDVLENMPKREALSAMTELADAAESFHQRKVLRRYRRSRTDGRRAANCKPRSRKHSAARRPRQKQTIDLR